MKVSRYIDCFFLLIFIKYCSCLLYALYHNSDCLLDNIQHNEIEPSVLCILEKQKQEQKSVANAYGESLNAVYWSIIAILAVLNILQLLYNVWIHRKMRGKPNFYFFIDKNITTIFRPFDCFFFSVAEMEEEKRY